MIRGRKDVYNYCVFSWQLGCGLFFGNLAAAFLFLGNLAAEVFLGQGGIF